VAKDLEKELAPNPQDLRWRGQSLGRVIARDAAQGDILLVQQPGKISGIVQGVKAGHEGRGGNMKVHISIDSSMEIVIKGSVGVYAVQSDRDSKDLNKTPTKASEEKSAKKSPHMIKYTPKKAGTTKKDKKAKKDEASPVPENAYEKQRRIKIAENKAKMAELGFSAPAKYCRNVTSPRKSPRKSSRKSPSRASRRQLELLPTMEVGELEHARDRGLAHTLGVMHVLCISGVASNTSPGQPEARHKGMYSTHEHARTLAVGTAPIFDRHQSKEGTCARVLKRVCVIWIVCQFLSHL
jgi:hypothetical protein